MKTFAEIEAEFVREKVLPDFAWREFAEPSPLADRRLPAASARVALVATAGAYLRDEQQPFARGAAGDASFREIPSDCDLARISFSHVGYDTERALRDPDVVFPLALLRTFAAEGKIGALAPRAFSFMGYSPDTQALARNADEVARALRSDAVDLVLLVPA